MSTSSRGKGPRRQGTAGGEETGRGVRAVTRALRILKSIGPGRSGASLTDLARSSGLAPSTTLRLVQTLEDEDFLNRLEDGTYTYGPAVLHLGLAARESVEILALAGRHLENVTAETGETTNLGVPTAHDEVLYVDQRVTKQALRAHSWLGQTVPQEGTAIGAAVRGLVGEEGWCMARATVEPGITALASPVYDHSGAIVAAMNITGPTERVLPHSEEFGRCLAREAAELTRRIGGTWPHRRHDAAPADAGGKDRR